MAAGGAEMRQSAVPNSAVGASVLVAAGAGGWISPEPRNLVLREQSALFLGLGNALDAQGKRGKAASPYCGLMM